MEDDPNIDIEENTFMYPRIENIYSDVNIKAEPIDVDEDEYDSIEIGEVSNDYYMPFPTKIILGSKPSTEGHLEPTAGPSTASHHWEDQENFFECAECNLLFPTQNELDSHKTASHSYLVVRPMSRAIKTERKISISSASSRSFLEDVSVPDETKRRQKAVKSTSKSALNKTFPMLSNALMMSGDKSHVDISVGQKKDAIEKGDRLLCKHCDIRFPNEIALIKHTYELLPETKFECDLCEKVFDSQFALRCHAAKHFKKTDEFTPSNKNDTLLQCLYCTCILMYPGFMKKHLMKNHKVGEFAVRHVKFTGKCAICSNTISNYKHYNSHMVKCHRKIFMSRTPYRFDGSPVKMKCSLCNQIFTTRHSAYKHKAEKHPEHSQKHTFNIVYDKPIKQLALNALKPKDQATKNLFGNRNYIPKQNLFKCNKCQIHFVSCTAAFAHSKRCSLAKGDWKCNKCRRMFTKSEKSLHMLQHQYSEKLKVHIVCDKIISKVLCRCPKCELLFDEMAFGEHISAECLPKSGLECKSCDLKIDSDSYAKHIRYHKKYNFSSDDFIVIDFVDASFENAPVKDEDKGFMQKLMYCTTCNCHFYRIKSKKKFHMDRQCVNLTKRICAICGLTFSQKPYATHKKHVHGNLNLTLSDIKFVRIQDSKVINPVMPDFYQCTKCEVRFVSSILKSNHNCSKQMFVKCVKCSRKYDTVTYDIHMTFHNYGRSKKEVSATLLKFYSCVACNYGFNSYDGVVEHCQRHYINAEKLDMKLCKVCKLNCDDSHKNSHSSRASFEIFQFNYEKLLTDEWLSGFDCLSKDVVDDILSRSVYGCMRNIRLEILIEGPPERTLYKCAQCELNFEQDYVLEHTMLPCSSSPCFNCSSCTAAFSTRVAKNNHINIHVIYGDDITFREIIFNNVIDKELNEALRTGKQKESLKFRKCQQCNLLIKKSEYQTHISAHDNEFEISQLTFRENKKLITYKLYKPMHAGKKQFTVYKCKSCNACILKKANMHRHKCGSPDRYEKCSKCSLNFLPSNIKRHVAQHAIVPKFNLKNISVLEFELMKTSGKSVNKRRRYSSDYDASAETQVSTVSKTYDTRKMVGLPLNAGSSEDSQSSILDDESTDAADTYSKKKMKKNSIEIEDCDIEETQNKIDNTSCKTKELFEPVLDIETWKIDMKNKLYQCERCYLCFAYKRLLVSHLSECNESSLSETPLKCNRCDIVFHPSMISFHEKLHELVRKNPIENYLYLINISTNGVNTDVDKQWLYKCKICDVQYLNTKSLETHFSTNHKAQEYFSCDICGLKFTQISRTRHIRIQHTEGNWSKDDLHTEITEKKIVDEGEINLTPYITPHSRKQASGVVDDISKDESQLTDGTLEEENSMIITKSADEHNKDMTVDTVASSSSFRDEKEMEFDVELLNDKNETTSNNLYKCHKCSKHFFTKVSLVRHMLSASHKVKPLRCDLCGLLFGRNVLKAHMLIQHKELKLNREDFVITTMTQKDNVIKEKVDYSKDLNTTENSSLNPVNTNLSITDERNDSLTDKNKETKAKFKTGVSGPIDNHLYKCVECSVYYTNRQTLLLHIVIKKHKMTEFLKCDICGLLFGKGSLPKHKKVQHDKLNLTRKDFIITDVFGAQLLDDDIDDESTKNASSIDTNESPLARLEVGEKHNDKEILADKLIKKGTAKMFRLYQCKDCRICVQKTERKLHVCCSDIQKKQCIQCCLSFRKTDVSQHLRLHRKYRELSRKNFVLIRFGSRAAFNQKIYKCVGCSTHFVSLNAIEWHMAALNHQTKRDYCKHCGLFFGKYSLSRHIYIHHHKMNLTAQQFDIVYVSDTDIGNKTNDAKTLNNSTNTTVSEPETTQIVKTIKKLFKCVECDVYLLTRASYYQHIYKHRKLDATEYIDCNICDFQFLNESLGVHMKSHKDKTFCLDKLLIEEYQPNSAEAPKIEFYFAKDNLNSKLVSTTTLFDNDDETMLNQTDEQLSVIDSTSDEMPKTKADDVIGIDANSYPHNSDSSREECPLNPIEEMSNTDVSIKSND